MNTRYRHLFSEHTQVPLRLFLDYEFKDRKQKNKRYSLRAFSTALRVPVSTLSRFLRGESNPSRRIIERICKQFDLPIDQIAELKEIRKTSSHSSLKQTFLDTERFTEVRFRDFVLLELLKLAQGPINEEFLADSLQVSLQMLHEIRERLERHGLLCVKGELWIPVYLNTSLLSLSDRSIEDHQVSMMESAIESIRKGPGLGKRSHSGIVIPINTKRWLEVIEKIDAFRNEMRALFSGEEPVDQIYQLTISFYPTSKKIMS